MTPAELTEQNQEEVRALCQFRGMLVVMGGKRTESGVNGCCPSCFQREPFYEHHGWLWCSCGEFAVLKEHARPPQ